MDSGSPAERKNGTALKQFKGRLRHTFLNRTILVFIFMALLMVLLVLANQQNIISIPLVMIDYMFLGISILLSYAMASIVARLTVSRIMDLSGETFEPEQRILLSKAYIGLLYTIATVYVFIRLGIKVQDIAIFLGLITTGFAFALRDVILSYICWFIMLTKKPFKIGDYIHVDGIEGQVKHIGMFYVLLDDSPETYEDYYRIPNKLFLEKTIHNYGKGRFSSFFELYLNKMPADIANIPPDLDALLDDLNAEIADTFSTKAILRLDSDKEGMKIRADYRCSYQEKDIIKDRLLRLIYKSMQGRYMQGTDDDQLSTGSSS
ncbi:MAG: mechanosensitive ion channel [Methanosarcinaceae archaeon]|nr:mechanosensitive ion channel [Methanosarcinaceae archaeon]